jgi:predicted O-methyltransferase YrrM
MTERLYSAPPEGWCCLPPSVFPKWLSRRPSPSLFGGSPWRTAPLDRIPVVPGMLGPEELQFLYLSAQKFFTGTGEIVDAGAFLGASAAALGAALRDNPRVTDKARRIHS